jgi:hypothetical protein
MTVASRGIPRGPKCVSKLSQTREEDSVKTIKMIFKDEELAGEYAVTATPPVCLGRTRSFFESESWPYRENATVYGPDITGRIVSVSLPGHLFMGSCLGILLMITLSIITLGTFFLVWAIIAFLVYAELGPSVTVSAIPVEEGITRITVTTNSAEHAEPVTRWLEQELEANPIVPSPHPLPTGKDSKAREEIQESDPEPIDGVTEAADEPTTELSVNDLGSHLGQVAMNKGQTIHIYEGGLFLYRGTFTPKLVNALPADRVSIEVVKIGFIYKVR